MAEDKKEAPAKAAEKPEKSSKGGKLGFVVAMVLFGAVVPFIYPTLLLLVGMIPTLIAISTDNDRQWSSAATVGLLNFAGVAPFIIQLWQEGQTLDNAVGILLEPMNWLIMLGAAGLGKLLLFTIPIMVASFTLTRAEQRLKLLKANLEVLKDGWGPEVATNKPIDRINR